MPSCLRLGVKRLAEYLGDNGSCAWATWRGMRGPYERLPSGFDSLGWTLEHNALVHSCAAELREHGYVVYRERQNAFGIEIQTFGDVTLPTPVCLVGQPDLIAIRADDAQIVDCKTGRPSSTHRIQGMLYQLLVPCNKRAPYVGRINGATLVGRIAYKGYPDVALPARTEAITPALLEAVRDAIRVLGRTREPVPEPSRDACRFCDVADCSVRFREQLPLGAEELALV